MRFIEESISKVLLKDLILVRPFVTLLGDFLKIDTDEIYKYDLFVINGQKIESQTIRSIFSHKFHEYTGSPINFSDYRQVTKYFANLLKIKRNVDESSSSEKEEEDVLDNQFAHNTSTSNKYYGNHEGELLNMRWHIMNKYKMISRIWHKFLREIKKKEEKNVKRNLEINDKEEENNNNNNNNNSNSYSYITGCCNCKKDQDQNKDKDIENIYISNKKRKSVEEGTFSRLISNEEAKYTVGFLGKI